MASARRKTISVLRSLGDGHYAPPQTLRTRTEPDALAVGDFSGNGWDGIAWVDTAKGTITVRVGLGGGRFGPARTYTVGAYPSCIAVADLNGDGRPDIVTANQRTYDVSVLMNLGHGRFGSAQDYDVGEAPTAVAIGDVTGDGKPDVIVADGEVNDVRILAGNCDGTLRAAQSFPTGPHPIAVALADLKGDGRLDIITADQSTDPRNSATSGVSVLMNLGGGTFAAPVNYGTSYPMGLVVGDFNGDGKLDIVVSDPAAEITALAGNGDGTFRFDAQYVASPGPLGLPVGPLGLVAGPFFGRGRTDLAMGITLSDSVSLLEANR